MGGGLYNLYADFKDTVDFLCIYQTEAHPKEMWNLGSFLSSVSQHTTMDDRKKAALNLIKMDEEHYSIFTCDPFSDTKIRLVCDNMDNTFRLSYNAHPDRVFLIQGEKLTYIGRTIFTQVSEPMKLMTDEARQLLKEIVG
ncbi:type II iodothyronine deiodinase-like isoform X2 [Anneissia japonica]|uniref:type II iodothyronine deiodinase-like isoform X2 n=1 Tax=Anneissia japonica TaxID=1529436 RepID=UPI0014256E17|nr:type II iodothyronine deiodinase-like isoform X2 [Anneissia japonica]